MSSTKQAAGAPGGGIPTPQATQLTVQKARLPKKKQTPDPSTGDDPGEFIKWVKLLLGLKPIKGSTHVGADPDPETPAATPKPNQDQLDSEAKAYNTLTNAVKTFLGGDQDLLKATKAIWDYLRTYSRNPQLQTAEGKAAFAQFTANLKVVYKLVNWLNWMVKWGRGLKEVSVTVGSTSQEKPFMKPSKHPRTLNVNGTLYKRQGTRERYSPTYWGSRGKYQKLYDTLYAQLVPNSGKADTPAGELLRQISRVYHDLYNNGWGNGPHTDAVHILDEYRLAIQDAMSNPANFSIFWQAFQDSNFGEDVGVDLPVKEQKALDDVVDGVIQVTKTLVEKQKKHPHIFDGTFHNQKRRNAATAYNDGSPLRPRKFNLPSDMAEFADQHNSPVVPDPQWEVKESPELRELAKYFWEGYKEAQLTKLPSLYGLGQTGLQLEQWAIMFQNEMGLSTPEMEELWQYLISVRWATASAFRSWKALLRRYELSPVRTPTYTKKQPTPASKPVAKVATDSSRDAENC